MNEINLQEEEVLSHRHQEFLKRLRLHDKNVRVRRVDGKLVFHGPVIGDGTMPGADGSEDAPGGGRADG